MSFQASAQFSCWTSRLFPSVGGNADRLLGMHRRRSSQLEVFGKYTLDLGEKILQLKEFVNPAG